MHGWIDRTIRGPDSDHVESGDFRKYFGLSEALYDSLRAAGTIPPPVRFNNKVSLHPWEHLVYFALWMRFFGDSVKENPPDK